MIKRRFVRKGPPKRKQATCKNGCYHYPHRMGGGHCIFNKDGTYKSGPIDDMPGLPSEEFPF